MSESSEKVVREVTIQNKEGLHTRPVMKFVDMAQTFQSDISVRSVANDQVVNGKSAMELMLLCATHGTVLEVSATGSDAANAADALAKLVQAEFQLDLPNT